MEVKNDERVPQKNKNQNQKLRKGPEKQRKIKKENDNFLKKNEKKMI